MEQEVEDDKRRQNELLDFIDDFINSEEFTHIQLKNVVVPASETRKRFYCRCKECWIQPEVVMTRSALVKKGKELYRIQKRFEKLLRNRNVRGIRKMQEKGIVIIREKIAEARQAFWCHKKERDLVTRRRREHVLDDLADTFGINTKYMAIASSYVTKVLAYKKVKRFKEKNRKQRTIDIVKKILRELKYEKKVNVKEFKTKKRGHVIEEEEQEIAVIEIPENVEKMEFRPVAPSKNTVAQAQSPPAVTQLDEDQLILPYIPIINTRNRYISGEPPKTDDLLNDLSKMLGQYKERMCFDLAEQLLKGKEYDEDCFFRTSPKSITFQSFKNGKVYTKKIRVYNGGTVVKKCMFSKFKVDDDVVNMFKAQEVGVHALLPGMHFDICITFSPQKIHGVAKGRAIFVTYTSDAKTVLQFSCCITCVPLSSTITIKPRTINFESMPMWEAKKNSKHKTLTIHNFDTKKCLIAITKIKDFEELDDDQSGEALNDCYECDYMQNLLNSCTYSAGTFSFSNQYLSVPGNEMKTLKVYFRNIDHVGSYCENYCITTFEENGDQIKCIGTYEVVITAEITGSFIEVEPLTIDFNVCVFNSVYHLPFKITNTSSIPHCVSIKFPTSLKQYLWSDAREVMVQGGATNVYQLKFVPRRRITRCKYYDESTHILEFPVYVALISKKYLEVPPFKLIIVAVLTEPNGLTLSCDVTECSQYVIDMGLCTTAETVQTTLKLINNSYVFQVFGFINLPPCLQIMPNFGFGELLPLEDKTLTLSFNPEAKDIPNFDLECEYADTTLSYNIVVETIKNLGGIDVEEKFTYALIKNLLERMELMLNEKPQRSLMKDVQVLIDLLRDENFYVYDSVEETSTDVSIPELESVSEVKCSSLEILGDEDEMIKNNKLLVKATIVDSLCDLSHQYVEFPDTPCGSYSIMSIHLKARTCFENVKCLCNYGKKHGKCKTGLNYKVRFEVVGDCNEISVEPTCGRLKSGQRIKLNLIARPQVPEKDVVETAMRLKKELLLMMPAPVIGKKAVVPDDEVILTRSDLYHAEMELWKSLEPYFLKTRFCCTIHYTSNDLKRKQEKLYFTTSCKVIKPSFVHNLKTQHIAFGLVPIGQTKRTVIEIQNISQEPIHPVVSLLSPTGFFTIPYLINLELARDHVLHLVLTCNPDAVKEVVEYFEVRAGTTIYPLMVSAEGVQPNFTITPNFLVCRLEATFGGFTESILEINNLSRASLSIAFIKLCELEGEAPIDPISKNAKTEPVKVEKFSNALNDEEMYVLTRSQKISGRAFFEVLGTSPNGTLEVNPLTKIAVKVVFGEPINPVVKTTKPEKSKGKAPPRPKKYFFVKYNLMADTSTFIKDLIFVGTIV